MLLRAAAAVMFVAAGGMAGIILSDRLKMQREMCREIGELLRSCAVQIRYRGVDVYRLASELKNCQSFKHLTFINELPEKYEYGEDFHLCWERAVMSQSDLPHEERQMLCSFGNTLGTSDIEGQLVSISALEEELETLENRREETFRSKGKLYRSVGMLFGVMAGILVI